jgi:hypothetical protein
MLHTAAHPSCVCVCVFVYVSIYPYMFCHFNYIVVYDGLHAELEKGGQERKEKLVGG